MSESVEYVSVDGSIPLTSEVESLRDYDGRNLESLASLVQGYALGDVVEHGDYPGVSYEDIDVLEISIYFDGDTLTLDFAADVPTEAPNGA